jgi:prepilin-type N-terminal cleavage/methylation domain-containing protein
VRGRLKKWRACLAETRRRAKRFGEARAGFTLIEVMVSIMILAISVVSIYGAQFATVATVTYASYATKGIQLARCRMSEIELEIQVDNGFETTDVTSSGDCCEMMEGEADDFTCRWEIKSIELPDLSTLLSSGADGGTGMGDLSMLEDLGMSGDMSGAGGAGDTGMLGMVQSFLPFLTEMLQEAIRRVTVTVEWEQGTRKREFMLSQFLVHPTQGPLQLMNAAADMADAAEQMSGAE